MQSVADRVSPGLVLADVGCDHGYLSIWLLQTGKIPSAIAMDVNQGPLDRAAQNAVLYGLTDRMNLRLSDGLAKLNSGEAQSVAIAGMGGMLMIRILDARKDLLEEMQELVLEPQSDVDRVRKFLFSSGYRIEDEDLVLEDGKFYPVIRAVRGREQESADPLEREIHLQYGRLLLERRHPVLRIFLEKKLDQTEQLIRKLEEHPTEKGLNRAEELKKEKQMLNAALAYFSGGSVSG